MTGPVPVPVRTVWLTGGWLFDGTGTPRRRADIAVTGDRIAAIEPVDPMARPVRREGESIDVTGCTVLPGFIDAHAHVGILRLTGQQELAPAVQAALVFANLREALAEGFTTLRDLGGVDGGLVEAVDQGLVLGPRVLPSGQILSQTGGHGDHRNRWGHERQNPSTGCGTTLPVRLIDGADDARRAAREQFRRGASQLKVFATGGVLSHGDPLEGAQLSLDELRAAVEEAQDRGTYVTAHAHTKVGLRRALRAGVRCIEHASIVDEETVADVAEHGAHVVGTLTVQELLRTGAGNVTLTKDQRESSARVYDATMNSLVMLHEAGVKVGCGADVVGERQGSRLWEPMLHAVLVGGSIALQRVTRINAEILGVDSDVGTVQVGKIADLVAFAGNVVAHPSLLREARPRTVLLGGVVQQTAAGERDPDMPHMAGESAGSAFAGPSRPG